MPLTQQGFDRDIAMAPDGSFLVYRSGSGQLVMRRLDRLDAAPLSGVTNARAPFVSPDSRWIAFFENNALKKVAVSGGSPITLARLPGSGPRGMSWVDDATIIVSTNDSKAGLLRVPAKGGEPTVPTTPDRAHGEQGHFFPSALPGGAPCSSRLPRPARERADCGAGSADWPAHDTDPGRQRRAICPVGAPGVGGGQRAVGRAVRPGTAGGGGRFDAGRRGGVGLVARRGVRGRDAGRHAGVRARWDGWRDSAVAGVARPAGTRDADPGADARLHECAPFARRHASRGELKTALASGKILVKDAIADITLQQVLTRPDEFDVIATLNLNGDYLSDALAAQVGGIGIVPGDNINYLNRARDLRATHGTAPKYSTWTT